MGPCPPGGGKCGCDNAQVSAADLENVRLSAQALLASDYFSLVGNDMQQAILQDTIEAYPKNLQLTMNRYNGGVASKSDVTLAQTSLADAKAQRTDLRIARAQLKHAIAVLTGQPPANLEIPPARSTVHRRPYRWRCHRRFSSAVPT